MILSDKKKKKSSENSMFISSLVDYIKHGNNYLRKGKDNSLRNLNFLNYRKDI